MRAFSLITSVANFTLFSVGTLSKSIPPGLKHFSNVDDPSGFVKARYGEGWTYLIRPDQHVAAAWANPSAGDIASALSRAMGGRQ